MLLTVPRGTARQDYPPYRDQAKTCSPDVTGGTCGSSHWRDVDEERLPPYTENNTGLPA